MDIVDLIIHVEQPLATHEQRALEDMLRRVEGVIAPRFNAPGSHLLSVAFNPATLASKRLLQSVQAAGYQAQLVGL